MLALTLGAIVIFLAALGAWEARARLIWLLEVAINTLTGARVYDIGSRDTCRLFTCWKVFYATLHRIGPLVPLFLGELTQAVDMQRYWHDGTFRSRGCVGGASENGKLEY